MSATSKIPPVQSVAETVEPKSAKPSHEGDGKFAKGNKGGPGNPHARETAKLRSMALQFMNEGKFLVLLETLYNAAIGGSIPAIRLLLQYTLGKPLEAKDPDQVDVDEFSLHQKSSHTTKELDALLNSLSVDYLNHLARNVWPMVVAQVTGSCAEQLRQEMVAEQAANKKEPSPNEKIPKTPPSPNGPASARAPSPNGDISAAEAKRPSPNGIFPAHAPSANGPAAGRAPSPNGVSQVEAPSPNAVGSGRPPSPNGTIGEAGARAPSPKVQLGKSTVSEGFALRAQGAPQPPEFCPGSK